MAGHQRYAVCVNRNARSATIVKGSAVAHVIHVAGRTLAIAASHTTRIGHAAHAAEATGRRGPSRVRRHHARGRRQRSKRQHAVLVGHAPGQLATGLKKTMFV